MDPVEIRRKNLLTAEEFPLKTGIIGQDFVEGVLDSGDYLGNLEKCLEMVDYEKFRKEIQPKARKEGKHLGIGVVAFTEGTALVRTKAPASPSAPMARSAWRPATAPRDRDTSPCLPRLWQMH